LVPIYADCLVNNNLLQHQKNTCNSQSKKLELLEDSEAFLEEIGLILTEEDLERKL
jgi:hypothetical protein